MEPIRTPSTIFSEQFEFFMSSCSQQEVALINQSMPAGEGPKPNVSRQQLKKIKKVVESPQQSPLKDLLTDKIYPVIISEYIFGDLQAKPLIINLIKCLKLHTNTLKTLMGKLTTFEEIKRMTEIFETVPNTLNNKLELRQLMLYVIDELGKTLEEGTISIAKNQFKTKWLQKFVEVLRCVNFMIRYIGNLDEDQSYVKQKSSIKKNIQICIENSRAVTKEVITQLYLASVFLDHNQPLPEPILNRVHYLHACGIVKNENTLPKMLEIVMTTKDTQIKAQLASILLKAFQMNFHKDKIDDHLKNNCFDIIITLFEVGRSIYSYLQEIVDIIMINGGAWNLQGNFTRKFFIARVALKHNSAEHILELWPNIISDCISQCGNMTIPYVTDCTEILFMKLYEQANKNYQQWMTKWIKEYKGALLANSRLLTRGIIQFINPIILKIDPNPCLLSQLLALQKDNHLQNSELGIISLLKCYRQLGKIVVSTSQIQESEQKDKKKDKAKKKITYRQKYPQIDQNIFIHIDNPQGIQISHAYLLDLLRSNQSMISCKTLEFLTTSRKPSTLILPEQMQLIKEFYRGCLKTSMPEYRKNYLNLTRRMLERFRKLYQRDILGKNRKQTNYYQDFIHFINQLIQLSFFNIYPDSIFQITNPTLEILSLIVTLFGEKEVQIRKGTFIQPSAFLSTHTSFFNIHNFYNLVSCLKSSYESIRKLAHKILENFKISKFSQEDRLKVKKLWEESIENTNKLSIRSYEFACRLLSYISTSILSESQTMPELQQLITELPQKYSLKQLNICELMLNLMRKRYEVFKQQFIQQSELYYNNLLHGILTFFSYLLESDIFIPTQATGKSYTEIQKFLSEFFTQITQILNFAVQISSANVSTVVLDTLAHGSQTDKKLKVDCRGHFLTNKSENKGNLIGSYLDSTALLTSMQNQEQGIENTLVVSFYLLTREAGLVFQTVGELVNHKKSNDIIPKKELVDLINTYFYALINLKHMGSVDRISIGLSKMSKVIFDHEDQDLNRIPERLLEKLITNLSEGKFTNILRRSAGVPYAFSCLLKSEALKRKHLIQKTINSLLALSSQSSETPIQLRIHSLNILKKLFQDSDLKQDLDIFVSDAFIKSINGFTSEQWGVRNSALMLFSTLANRTVGIKPTYNLLEFFHKCPKLLSFIEQKLTSLKTITMYPPLYPIVLLLSRLLPFDIKEKARMTIKSDNNTSKQVRKDELLKLLPLIQSAGDNHNFMGRVMTAKAILPFMELTAIVPHCLNLLQQFRDNIKNKQLCNNTEHYRLTQCYHLFLSYQEIVSEKKMFEVENLQKKQIEEIIISIVKMIQAEISLLCSPTVSEILFKIIKELLQHYFSSGESSLKLYETVYHELGPLFGKIIQQEIALGKGTRSGDLGLSLMHISIIELLHLCEQYFISCSIQGRQNCKYYSEYIQHLIQDKINERVDNQIRCLIIEKICQIIRSTNSIKNASLEDLRKSAFEWMKSLELKAIHNDDIFIHALELLESTESMVKEPVYQSGQYWIIDYLKQIQEGSQNKYMKMAIFKYSQNLITIIKEESRLQQIRQFLWSLLKKYSNPDQLEELRETCVEYFEEVQQRINPHYLIVYLRLLEDEEQEIRKRTSEALCKMLKISTCNEEILSEKLIAMFINSQQLNLANFFRDILQENSDYEIKHKNFKESRIFSYDKPNKYRTDINTLFMIIRLLNQEGRKQLKEVVKEIICKEESDEDLIQVVESYRTKIMERDEYQFERIMRNMIGVLPEKGESFEGVKHQHPIFQSICRK